MSWDKNIFKPIQEHFLVLAAYIDIIHEKKTIDVTEDLKAIISQIDFVKKECERCLKRKIE